MLKQDACISVLPASLLLVLPTDGGTPEARQPATSGDWHAGSTGAHLSTLNIPTLNAWGGFLLKMHHVN